MYWCTFGWCKVKYCQGFVKVRQQHCWLSVKKKAKNGSIPHIGNGPQANFFYGKYVYDAYLG